MRTRPHRRGRPPLLAAALVAFAALLAAPPAAAAPKKTGTVVVRCPVDGASVFVDGEEIGTLPIDPLTIQFGRHTVRVVRNGLIDYSKDIMLRPGEEIVVTALPDKAMSLLTIQTGVAGAEVLVDGKVVGRTPIREMPINPGNHSMFIRKDGLQPYKEDFKVPPNREYVSKPPLKTRDGKPAGQDDFGLAALDLAPAAAPSDGLGLGSLDLEPVAAAPRGKPAKAPEPDLSLDLGLGLEPVAPPPAKPGKPPEPAVASLDLGMEPSLDLGLPGLPPPAPEPAPAPSAKTAAKTPPGKTPPGKAPPAKVAPPPPVKPPPAKVAAKVAPPPPPPAFTLPPVPVEPPKPAGPPFYTRTWFQATAGGVAGAAAITALAAYVIVPYVMFGEIGPKPYAERHDPNSKCPDCLIVLNR